MQNSDDLRKAFSEEVNYPPLTEEQKKEISFVYKIGLFAYVRKHYSAAHDIFKRLISKDFFCAETAAAQYFLGYMYYTGQDVETNYIEAAKWFELSAASHYIGAQSILGIMYYDGQGVAKDLVKACALLNKVAEIGCEASQLFLVHKHFNDGHDVSLDNKKGFKWLASLADNKDLHAQYLLGRIHYMGLRDVEINHESAFQWFMTAATNNFAPAQFSVGYMYHHGEGVVQNNAEACKWLKKSADQGNAGAPRLLNKILRETNHSENIKPSAPALSTAVEAMTSGLGVFAAQQELSQVLKSQEPGPENAEESVRHNMS
ncbi:MAG: hypothetical protein CK424_07700 [Legionella sp.]|nr:MAG: hypothetical protein CK424_07700 [Legionella sp.]